MGTLLVTQELTEYKLKRGKALIISGPEGAGKSKLAQELALQMGGKFEYWNHEKLYSAEEMAAILGKVPAVVIVDIAKPNKRFFEFAKALACEEKIEVRPKGKDTYMADNPVWIFLTQQPVALPQGTRRFDLITLN